MQNANILMNEDAIKEKFLRGNNAKLKAAKIAAAAMIITALILSSLLFGASGSQSKWVYDGDDILSDATIAAINNRNEALYGATGEKAEIVVVVERESGKNRDLPKRAEKLFKDYGVSSDGMLFIVSVPENAAPAKNAFEQWGRDVGEFFGGLFGGDRDSHACFIGKNVDHSLSVKKEEIFANYFNVSYSAADYNVAVLDTFNAFLGEFEKYFDVNTVELTAYSNSPSLLSRAMKTISTAAVIIVGLFAAILIIGAIFGRNKNYGVKRVYKRVSWF